MPPLMLGHCCPHMQSSKSLCLTRNGYDSYCSDATEVKVFCSLMLCPLTWH